MSRTRCEVLYHRITVIGSKEGSRKEEEDFQTPFFNRVKRHPPTDARRPSPCAALFQTLEQLSIKVHDFHHELCHLFQLPTPHLLSALKTLKHIKKRILKDTKHAPNPNPIPIPNNIYSYDSPKEITPVQLLNYWFKIILRPIEPVAK